MRFAIAVGFVLFCAASATGETVIVTMEDGTTIELSGVPKGAKIKAKLLSKPEPARADFDAKAIVQAYLEENTNDPKKLQVISMSAPVPLSQVSVLREGMTNDDRSSPVAWEAVERPGFAVGVKYRAANSVGAVVRQESLAVIGPDGTVVSLLPARDTKVHASAAARQQYLQQSDPFLDELESVIKPRRR